MSSHVPKFGNWDSDNMPYTTFFEIARREKAGMKMNPNDLEENPEAFMIRQGGFAPGHEIDGGNLPPSAAVNGHNGQCPSLEEQHGSFASQLDSSNRSSSIYLQKQKSHNPVPPSNGKKASSESSKSSSPSVTNVPGHSRQRSGNQPSANIHRRAASIPKFGEWNETDPRSGEGFTMIFDKVKEEKHAAASEFLTLSPQPISSYPTYQEKRNGPSAISKMCCCLFSQGKRVMH